MGELDVVGPIGGVITVVGGIVAMIVTRRSQSVKDVALTIDTFIRVTDLELARLKSRVGFLERYIRKNGLPVPHADPKFSGETNDP